MRMASQGSRRAVQPGEPAADFEVSAVHHEGTVSLANYRGKRPLFLALYRGLYCPFCRRHVVQLQTTAEKLRCVGVETLGIVGSAVERVRFYMRYRPVRYKLGADPDLTTHRAYGLPQSPMTTEIWNAVEFASNRLARELGTQVPERGATEAIGRLDGFETTESERGEAERHQAQFTGQVLVDREGIVRWTNIECAKEGLGGIDRFPSDEELLEAAGALSK
jgi:peroxiredoxin